MVARLSTLKKAEIKSLELFQRRIADFQSSYPDLPITLTSPHFTSKRESLVFLGAILMASEDYDYTSTEWIYRRISNLCYQHWYDEEEGWNKIQDLLENVLTYRQFVEYVTTEIMSPNDYYGNYIGQIVRALGVLEPKTLGLQSGKVRKRSRKRGYDDKGNQRPSWKTFEEYDICLDSGEDRRTKVLHPLVGRTDFSYPAWTENNQFKGIMCDRNSRTKKEGDNYDLLLNIQSYQYSRHSARISDDNVKESDFKSNLSASSPSVTYLQKRSSGL